MYGNDHAEVAQSWHCMGNAAAACGRYEEARELHNRAIDMKRRHLGHDHVQVSYSLGMLATDHIDKMDFVSAIEIQEEALRIRLKAYGEMHPRVADMYFNKAGSHAAIEQFEEAEALLHKA
jgi:tetratricopeptide (TPR) repeat protein